MADSNDVNPKPVYARGADLSRVPLAADTPALDLRAILGVDSANPLLRAVRIERGYLDPANLPRELIGTTPFDGDAIAKLREGGP